MLRNRHIFSSNPSTTNFGYRPGNMTFYDVNACGRQYFFTTLMCSDGSSSFIPWPIGKPKSAPESSQFYGNFGLNVFCVTTFQNGGRRRYRGRTSFLKIYKTLSNRTVTFFACFWGLDIRFQVSPFTLT